MHAIQTSGNCIRNITTDHFAGVAPDEHVDPRALAEILRQWSTFHPEFAYLPRKFKIALNGAEADRAATLLHDIGLRALRNGAGRAGPARDRRRRHGPHPDRGPGGPRVPALAATCSPTSRRSCASTTCHGRRDNLYKARIKILVKALGIEEFRAQVEAEWAHLRGSESTLTDGGTRARVGALRAPALRAALRRGPGASRLPARRRAGPSSAGSGATSIAHRRPGYARGDAVAQEDRRAAGRRDRRPDGRRRGPRGALRLRGAARLPRAEPDPRRRARARPPRPLATGRGEAGLATPNVGLLTNIICCPGGDFCALANAKSIPVAEAIQRRFDDLDCLHDIGELDLNISGCMNSCGHHHIGHIGILGVDKNGSEWYQVSIGGEQGIDATLGEVIGPSFAAAEMPGVVERPRRDLPRAPHRGRAVRRHRPPHRHRAVQGPRLRPHPGGSVCLGTSSATAK